MEAVKICLIGAQGSGKSCWVKKLSTGNFDSTWEFTDQNGSQSVTFDFPSEFHWPNDTISSVVRFEIFEVNNVQNRTLLELNEIVNSINPDFVLVTCSSENQLANRQIARILTVVEVQGLPRILCAMKPNLTAVDSSQIECEMDLKTGENIHEPFEIILELMRDLFNS